MLITPDEVSSAEEFLAYAHQRLGMPRPRPSAVSKFKKEAASYLESNPALDWPKLATVVDWCKIKGVRPRTPWGFLDCVQSAWGEGFISTEVEEDDWEEALSGQVREALALEEDERWRQRLMTTTGRARATVLQQWQEHRNEPGQE